MTDSFGRNISYMRVSVTDRCNLRCKYCMPEDLKLVSRNDVLQKDEIVRVCRIASECGIKHIRITGGEPFARKNCMDIIRGIQALPKLEAVTVTTNGVLLSEHLQELEEIGVTGVNISLDTLDEQAFYRMTGRNDFAQVRASVQKSFQSKLNVKINCVPIRGFNEDQLIPLAELATQNKTDVRFIEAMPIGHGNDFEGVSGGEVLAKLRKAYPDMHEISGKRGFGPAKYYTATGFKGAIGFIDAISHGFCGECNRVRLTSEGFLKSCLYFESGVDLRPLIRGGASDGELAKAFEKAVGEKPERHLFGSDKSSETSEMSKVGG